MTNRRGFITAAGGGLAGAAGLVALGGGTAVLAQPRPTRIVLPPNGKLLNAHTWSYPSLKMSHYEELVRKPEYFEYVRRNIRGIAARRNRILVVPGEMHTRGLGSTRNVYRRRQMQDSGYILQNNPGCGGGGLPTPDPNATPIDLGWNVTAASWSSGNLAWFDASDVGGPIQTTYPMKKAVNFDCPNVLAGMIVTATSFAAYVQANPGTFGPICAIAAAYLDGGMGALAFLAACLALGGPADLIALAAAVGVGAILIWEYIQCVSND